jgi:hypothetical protein
VEEFEGKRFKIDPNEKCNRKLGKAFRPVSVLMTVKD